MRYMSSKGNLYVTHLFPLMKNKCICHFSLSPPCTAMHIWYRSKSFFIPSEKKIYVFTMPNQYRLLVWTPNVHKLYDTPRHRALWLVHIHSWYPRLSPLVLTWFVGFLWSRHSLSRCVLPCAMLTNYHNSFRPVHFFFMLLFYPLIPLSLVHRACSILHLHPPMNFCRFESLCLQKAHYGSLFLEGAIAEWNVYTSDLVTPCHSIEIWDVARS